MVIDWVTFLVLLDYLAFLIVLTVFIGSRFNTWPTNRKTMLSGLPRDYIDPKRYRLFYIIYLATYVIIIFRTPSVNPADGVFLWPAQAAGAACNSGRGTSSWSATIRSNSYSRGRICPLASMQ